MKFLREIPSADKAVDKRLKEEGWTRLKEPSGVGMATLYSIPVMFINGLIFAVIVFYIYPPFKDFLNQDGFNLSLNLDLFTIVLYGTGTYVFLTLHEFIHASLVPHVWTSDKTSWGIQGFFGFVYTTEEIKRNRFLLISVMPFLVLSILLPFVLLALGWLNGVTIFLCLMNAMGSCVDILNMIIVVSQVPRKSFIVNNGFYTYFK